MKRIILSIVCVVGFISGWIVYDKTHIDTINCPICSSIVATDVNLSSVWNITKCNNCGYVFPVYDNCKLNYEQYLEDVEHYNTNSVIKNNTYSIETEEMIYIYNSDSLLIDSIRIDETCPD